MFQKLREDHNLSRAALAEQLQVSPGYLLKAEQCVFPSPPAPLVEYWHQSQQLDRDYLKAAYYDQQRRRRRDWLNSWIPDSANIQLEQADGLSGFTNLWRNRFTSGYHPSQYAVSVGLCVPASAVYFAERHPNKPVAGSILVAVDDLIQYARSGEWHAADFMDDNIDFYVSNLIALKEVLSERGSNKHSRISA